MRKLFIFLYKEMASWMH